MEMVIGLPVEVGEEIFIRDEEGKVVGQKNTPVEMRAEHREELAKRKAYHDARIEDEHKNGYKSRRAAAYPDLGELADLMYWKIDAAIMAGRDVPAGEKAWYEKCKAVKEGNPKPTV